MITTHRLSIYWKIWYTIALNAFQETFLNRWVTALFLFGKALRFSMSLFFLLILQRTITGFAGYTTDQVIIFFLTYQFTDGLTQILYRGVYMFSQQVRSGELDFYLSKPLNPLFRILTGKPDIIDALFFVPTTLVSFFLVSRLHVSVTPTSFLLYCALLVNSFLIGTAFHIFVICLGVLTTEVDNAIMLYRDTTALSRFPVNMYAEPLRFAFFFIIPIGVMNTVPAQVLLQLQPSVTVLFTMLVGVGFFLLSLFAWKFSIRKYTSAGG